MIYDTIGDIKSTAEYLAFGADCLSAGIDALRTAHFTLEEHIASLKGSVASHAHSQLIRLWRSCVILLGNLPLVLKGLRTKKGTTSSYSSDCQICDLKIKLTPFFESPYRLEYRWQPPRWWGHFVFLVALRTPLVVKLTTMPEETSCSFRRLFQSWIFCCRCSCLLAFKSGLSP